MADETAGSVVAEAAVGSASPQRAAGGVPATPAAKAKAAPALRMHGDAPVTNDDGDRLRFTALADAIAQLVDNEDTETPFTMAISAPWGAGKTSLAQLVARRLRQRPLERGQ